MKNSGLSEISRQLKSYFEIRGISANESQDFVQEVFFKLLRAGKDVEAIEKAYAFSTADRLMIDRWRKRQRDPLANISVPPDSFDNEFFTECENSPEYLYHEDQLVKKFRKIIRSLTWLQRQTFISHRLRDYSIRDIAEARNVTESSVEKLLHKARSHIHISLKEII